MSTPVLPLERDVVAHAGPAGRTIVFEDVRLEFDRKLVLDGISFQLARGETKAIFGIAGSGKSSILKLTLGLIRPDRGHIYVLGEDVTQMREEDLFAVRRKVGMVF